MGPTGKRQAITRDEAWELPSSFRRLDIALSKALVDSLKLDILLSAPLGRLAKSCLLAGIHIPSRLVLLIISQASAKPARLVQDVLESR